MRSWFFKILFCAANKQKAAIPPTLEDNIAAAVAQQNNTPTPANTEDTGLFKVTKKIFFSFFFSPDSELLMALKIFTLKYINYLKMATVCIKMIP